MAPPGGLVEIESISRAVTKSVSLMGVVVDYMSPAATRGTDWQCTFSLVDSTSTHEGLRVKVFSTPDRMPQIWGTGDVVHLSSFAVKEFKSSTLLLSNFGSSWSVFHCRDIPEQLPADKELQLPYTTNGPKGGLKLNQEHMRYAIELCGLRERSEWDSREAVQNSTTPTSGALQEAPGPLREKFALIASVGAGRFYDLVGEVVKIWPNGSWMDLYVTDYTENSLLYNYGREDDGQDASKIGRDGDPAGYLDGKRISKKKHDWNGPKGCYTLTITLFPPHADFAGRKLKLGHHVLLSNVHVKLGKGPGPSRLEGAMHNDTKHPERVNVSMVSPETDERVKELLRRKRDYVSVYGSKGLNAMGASSHSIKRKHDHASDVGQARKREKRQRQKTRDAAKTGAQARDAKDQRTTGSAQPGTRAPQPPRKPSAALELNKNVVAAFPEQPLRTIADVNRTDKTHAYTPQHGVPTVLPFQNVLFRAKVRVVDYHPARLEDFAVRTSEYDCLSDDEHDNSSGNTDARHSTAPEEQPPSPSPSASSADSTATATPRRRRWAWFFTLLLEDASRPPPRGEADRIAVHVAHEDAEFLLSLDAANLRRHGHVLEKLHEKLFLLWGDLEERKRKRREVLGAADGNGGRTEAEQGSKAAPKLPSNKPFECCIKEYGVRDGNEWRRHFRMFNTRID